MNEIQHLAALAAKAKAADSSASEIGDIADRVLADISRAGRHGSAADHGVLKATAAVTCVVAILAAITAAQSVSSFLNPLAGLSDSPVSTEMR